MTLDKICHETSIPLRLQVYFVGVCRFPRNIDGVPCWLLPTTILHKWSSTPFNRKSEYVFLHNLCTDITYIAFQGSNRRDSVIGNSNLSYLINPHLCEPYYNICDTCNIWRCKVKWSPTFKWSQLIVQG